MADEPLPDEPPERPPFVQRFLLGFKLAIGLVVAFPVLVLLTPLWFVHVWSERRAGRPDPEPPWALLRQQRLDESRRLAERERIRRLYEEVRLVEEAGLRMFHRTLGQGEGEECQEERRSLIQGLPALGPVALVTGGGARLGSLLCHELASLGFRVAVAHHHSAEPARELVAQIKAGGGKAEAFAADLRDPGRCQSLLAEVEEGLGELGVLVNCASLFRSTPLDALAEGGWEGMEELLAVNLRAPLWLAMAAGERMRRRHAGLIVNIADIWGERPLGGHPVYSVSKAGLLMATRSLARELAPEVRVNAIAPGAVLPPEEGERRQEFQRLLDRTPLSGTAGPDGVLAALRYLVRADFVTGEVLHVDGGRLLV